MGAQAGERTTGGRRAGGWADGRAHGRASGRAFLYAGRDQRAVINNVGLQVCRLHGFEYLKRIFCLPSICVSVCQRVVRDSVWPRTSCLHRFENVKRLLCLASKSACLGLCPNQCSTELSFRGWVVPGMRCAAQVIPENRGTYSKTIPDVFCLHGQQTIGTIFLGYACSKCCCL